jgi:hypothetical protein
MRAKPNATNGIERRTTGKQRSRKTPCLLNRTLQPRASLDFAWAARPAIGPLRLKLLMRHVAQHQSGQQHRGEQNGRQHSCLQGDRITSEL